MHEIRIADDLSAIVLETAKRENLSKVTRVNLSFGQMIQIVPDIFRFAFTVTVQDTLAAGAVVEIEILPVKMKCLECGKDFQLKGNLFSCEHCGSTDIDLIQGKELFIKSIEGE